MPGIKTVLSRGFLLIFSVGILVPPTWLLYSNFRDSSEPQSMSTPHTVSPVTNNYDQYHPTLVYSPQRGTGEENTSDLCIIFQYGNVDAAAEYANFSILIEVTEHGKEQLQDLGSAQKTVQLDISSNSGLDNIPIRIPISELTSSGPTSCYSKKTTDPEVVQTVSELIQPARFGVKQAIFLLSQTQAFPDDWYELNDTVTASVGKMPLPASILIMTRNYDLPLTVNIDNNPKGAPLFEFVIDRSPWVIAYTYIVSIMPILLLVILIAIQRSRKQDPPKPHEIAFGVAATIVAILPLHAVLIPSALSDHLTRLDIIFGTEVTLLVALSIIWVAMRTMPFTGHGPGAHAPGGQLNAEPSTGTPVAPQPPP
jgi:hypothetical protein